MNDRLTVRRVRTQFSALLCGAVLACGGTLAAAATIETRGALVLDGVPAHSASVETLDRWLVGRSATFQDFMGDGSVLVTTRFADAEQVHRISMPRGAREQLTFDNDPVAGESAAPVGTHFVFARDRGGNENAQLYSYDFESRHTRMLTDGRSRHGNVVWSPDGNYIAFQSNARDGTHQDIYVRQLQADSSRLLVASQGQTWSPLDWSPDGRQLLIQNYVSIGEAWLAIVDVASGAIRPLQLTTDAKIRTGIGSAKFSADGRGIWFSADAGGEFRELRFLDLDTGRTRSLTAGVPWDVDDITVGADGHYLAYVTNVDGYDRLTVYDLGAARAVPLAGLPDGLVTNLRFDRSGTKLGLSIESSRVPRDVWTYDIAQHEATRWTFSETGTIDPTSFVAAQVVRYPTWDRVDRQPRLVPALVYRPGPNAPRTARGKQPVLIDIHGGPEGQSRPGYSAFTQYLVNEMGYVVIQPNVRGSTGYGRAYSNLDNGMLREDAVRDIGSLLVWIAAQPGFDVDRVVVTGGSYGGYMSLATMVNYGDRLRGGIDVVGISNFVTFLNNTSSYRRDLRRAEYGDERDPKMNAFLQRISPLARARAIRKPLLVVQGLNDPRVPANESAQMVAAVRANGTEVWYLAAKDEGHGFRKKGNRDFYLKTVATFLERLRGD